MSPPEQNALPPALFIRTQVFVFSHSINFDESWLAIGKVKALRDFGRLSMTTPQLFPSSKSMKLFSFSSVIFCGALLKKKVNYDTSERDRISNIEFKINLNIKQQNDKKLKKKCLRKEMK